jgi:hypothetical protein
VIGRTGELFGDAGIVCCVAGIVDDESGAWQAMLEISGFGR